MIGIILLYMLWGIVGILEMPLLSVILGQFVSVGFIALIIIFQPEIRRFLLYIGNTTLKGRSGILGRFLKDSFSKSRDRILQQLEDAMWSLSAERIGALIVLPKHLNIEGYADSGQVIDAEVNASLIKSIFNKYSPMHDGAMVIFGSKIHAVGCVMPVSGNTDLPSHLGLRHRAGLGASESTDAAAFIVSEETGDISLAYKGHLERGVTKVRLGELLRLHYID